MSTYNDIEISSKASSLQWRELRRPEKSSLRSRSFQWWQSCLLWETRAQDNLHAPICMGHQKKMGWCNRKPSRPPRSSQRNIVPTALPVPYHLSSHALRGVFTSKWLLQTTTKHKPKTVKKCQKEFSSKGTKAWVRNPCRFLFILFFWPCFYVFSLDMYSPYSKPNNK